MEVHLARKVIAITSGVILAFGYMSLMNTSHLGPRLILGITFGISITVRMILKPEHVTRNHLLWYTILLGAFVIWVAIYEAEELISATIWASSLLLSQLAFFMYPSKQS